MKGKLFLIPTPIENQSPLEPVALELLKSFNPDRDILLVEELKECRRRWIHWGLDRNAIEHFVLYNEHNQKEDAQKIIQQLKKGKRVFLMSDCGLPAFCDPGQYLVDQCHDHHVAVTSTPFANSISLAIALSGFSHQRFMFEGFVENKKDARRQHLKQIISNKVTTVIMDTPYRLTKLLSELQELGLKKRVFLGLDLNTPEESLLRGPVSDLLSQLEGQKREFILVIE